MLPIHVLIADDHAVVRIGLSALLETEPGHRVRCFLTEKEGAE